MNSFQIVPGVGLWELNPMNHALRNDYVDNLISLAVVTLPHIYNSFGKCSVIEGFVNKNDQSDSGFINFKREGRCIVLSRSEMDESELIKKLREVLEKIKSNVGIIVALDRIYLLKEYSLNKSLSKIDNNKLTLIYTA